MIGLRNLCSVLFFTIELSIILPELVAQEVISLSYSLDEEQRTGTFIGNLLNDARSQLNVTSRDDVTRITFTLQNASGGSEGDGSRSSSNLFKVDEKTGILTTAAILDRDVICLRTQTTCVITLYITVQPQAKLIKVDVTINDINDNAPYFDPAVIYTSIYESQSVGEFFPLPLAIDRDALPDNGYVSTYLLEPPTSSDSPFSLVTQSSPGGVIDLRLSLTQRLDREVKSSYQLRLVAYDRGIPAKSGSLLINITVADVNDNSPVFQKDVYEARIPDTMAVGSVLVTVTATDADIGDNAKVVYRFADRSQTMYGRQFSINQVTGQVTLIQTLPNAGIQSSYNLSILATDGGTTTIPAIAALLINVYHVNQRAPVINIDGLPGDGQAKVSRSSSSDTIVALINAVDPDGMPGVPVSCSVNSVDFKLVAISDTDYKLVTARSFTDGPPASTQFMLYITCTDQETPPLSAVKSVIVVITDDVTTAPPPALLTFTSSVYYATVVTGNSQNLNVITVKVNQDNGQTNGVIRFSIKDQTQSGLFKIDETSGTISTLVTFTETQIGQYILTVTAKRTGTGTTDQTTSTTVKITVTSSYSDSLAFSQTRYVFSISENLPVNTEVGRVTVVNGSDISPVYVPGISLIDRRSSTTSLVFAADSTGVIRTLRSLDAEITTSYELVANIMTSSGMTSRTSATCDVIINVIDVNDNIPIVTYPSGVNDTILLGYDLPLGGLVVAPKFIDKDVSSAYSNLTFSIKIITPDSGKDLFTISRYNGDVRLTKEGLSAYINQTFFITVQASDGKYTSEVTIKVLVSQKSYIELGGISSPQTSHDNRILILACVLAAAFVLICIIMAAIFVVCRRKRRKAASSTSSGQSSGPVYWTSVELSENGGFGGGGGGSASEGEERNGGVISSGGEDDDDFRIKSKLDLINDAARRKKLEEVIYGQDYQGLDAKISGAAGTRLDGSSDSSDSGYPDQSGSQGSNEDNQGITGVQGHNDGSKRSSKSSELDLGGDMSPSSLSPRYSQQFNLHPPPPSSNINLLAPPSPFNSTVPDWLRAQTSPSPGVVQPLELNRRSSFNGNSSFRSHVHPTVMSASYTNNRTEFQYPTTQIGALRSSLRRPNQSGLDTSNFNSLPRRVLTTSDSSDSGFNSDNRRIPPTKDSRLPDGRWTYTPSPIPSTQASRYQPAGGGFSRSANFTSTLQKPNLLRSSSRKSVHFDDDVIDGGGDAPPQRRVHFAEHDQLAYLERTSSGGSAFSDEVSDMRDDVSRTSSDITSADYDVINGVIRGRAGKGEEIKKKAYDNAGADLSDSNDDTLASGADSTFTIGSLDVSSLKRNAVDLKKPPQGIGRLRPDANVGAYSVTKNKVNLYNDYKPEDGSLV